MCPCWHACREEGELDTTEGVQAYTNGLHTPSAHPSRVLRFNL